VDIILGSPEQLPTGTHFPVGFWRKDPSRPQTLRKELETGQTLDHQSRSPIPGKKNARDRLIAWCSQQPSWAIGFLDEVWWSRFALPALNAWQSKEEPVRLVEQVWQKHDPDPKAFACYGVLWQQGPVTAPLRHQMSLRFVDGRPVSAITTQFLEWICTRLQAAGKTCWVLIWDNASWHYSKLVRAWIREHNRQVKQESKGVRILPFFLPTKSPWLNPIERKAGCMPRRLLWNPMGGFPPGSWLNAFVLILAVPTNLLFPLLKRLREFALGYSESDVQGHTDAVRGSHYDLSISSDTEQRALELMLGEERQDKMAASH
jgi:DDE superfamily endonuclease